MDYIKGLLQKVREQYDFFIQNLIEKEDNNLYFLLQKPSLIINHHENDPYRWDDEPSHIQANVYVPGDFISDQSVLAQGQTEWEIVFRVYYLSFEVRDDEIERLKYDYKKLDAKSLAYDLEHRKIINIEKIDYYPKRFAELYLNEFADYKDDALLEVVNSGSKDFRRFLESTR